VAGQRAKATTHRALAEVRRGWAILSYFEPRREGKFCVCKDPL
jgi:hypothetical protein